MIAPKFRIFDPIDGTWYCATEEYLWTKDQAKATLADEETFAACAGGNPLFEAQWVRVYDAPEEKAPEEKAPEAIVVRSRGFDMAPNATSRAELLLGMCDEDDEKFADIVTAFALASSAVERLPDGRHKSLAATALEDAFTRAVYAVMGVGGILPSQKRVPK